MTEICLIAHNGRRIPIHAGEVFFGRSGENGVVVKNASISRRHAVIESDGGGVWITDLFSRHGTYVNGEKIASGLKIYLCHGDKIRFTPWVKSLTVSIVPALQSRFDDKTLVVRDRFGFEAHQISEEGDATNVPDPISSAGHETGVATIKGQVIIDRFRIVERISRGGMGKIYLAQEMLSKRFVALKVIKDFAEDEDKEPYVQQFIREAVITARLQHPHIIPVYELGFFERGKLYYTMRYISGGQTLDKKMGRADFFDFLGYIKSAAEAVAYAHRQNLWHRDLKPGNILIGEFNDLYVIDWGLVSVQPGKRYTLDLPEIVAHDSTFLPDDLFQETEEAITSISKRRDQQRVAVGTPRYMAPEQFLGMDHLMGVGSDIWALGVIFYETLTGLHPFFQYEEKFDNPVELAAVVCSKTPPEPRELNRHLPSHISRLCMAMLAQKPDQRLDDLSLFAREIDNYLSHYRRQGRRA